MSPNDTNPESLLDHARWLQSLARQLVADAHLADDLAQETLTAALAHPPSESAKLRPWLASVLRNFLRQMGRSEGRRRAREEALALDRLGAARSDSPEALLEEVEAHRELTDAVLALDEPYRTAIALRYFRELPPRAIARRLGVPVSTVNSRLARGLDALRERLDRSLGRRGAWMAFVLPLAHMPKGVGAANVGVLAVNTKLVVAALSVAVIGTIAAVTLRRSSASPIEPGPSPVVLAAPRAQPVLDTSVPSAAPPPDDAREAVALAIPAAAPAATPSTPSPASWRMRGRVFDADGAPAPGIALAIEGDDAAIATSGAGGWFELATLHGSGRLVAARADWVTVKSGIFRRDSPIEPVAVVARPIELAGSVADEQGRSLEGARVAFQLPGGFDTRFGQSLESSRGVDWSARSGSDGRFRLERVPSIAGAHVGAVLDGYQLALESAPETSAYDLALTLKRPSVPGEGSLHGRVVDASGAPVEGARVGLGLTCALSRENGEFELDLRRAVTADTLRAVKAGFQPAVMERPYDTSSEHMGWPETVEVRLGPAALSISGIVVDHEGKPRTGVRVWLADPTPFGVIGMMPTPIESLMAGAMIPPQAVESQAHLPKEDGDHFNDYIGRAGPPSALWNFVMTDGDGRFKLDGLCERSYRLKVHDDKTLVEFTSDLVRAGESDARIELPRPELWPVVSGRVVNRDGKPVADVRILLQHDPFSVSARVFGGRVYVAMMVPRESTTSDAEGRFEFKDVPKSGIKLDLQSDETVPTTFELLESMFPTSIEIRVDTRCRVEIVLEKDPERADSFGAVDAEGKGVDVLVLRDNSVNAYTEVPLVDGRSGIVSLSSAARTLLLYKDEELVERIPLALHGGEVNLIRL